jgi:hypothetical protein
MRIYYVSIMIALLSGCATTYQPSSFSGGFSETRLGEDTFQVSFRGNGYTSTERASDFSLLRSAELTLQNGFRYFIVVDSKESSKLDTYTTPTTSHTTGNAYGYGNYAYGNSTTTTYGGETYAISKPRATNTIVCFKEKPQVNGLVFEAEYVLKSIKGKYGIAE